jgi:hypothetical protein
MESKESYTEVLIRLDQRFKDFIQENGEQHKEIVSDIKDLCLHVNHEVEVMSCRVKSLEDSRVGQDAINKDSKEKASDKYQKLREYSLLIGFAVSFTTIILNLPKILTMLH